MTYKTKGFKRAFSLILAVTILVAAGSVLYRQQITQWLEQDARNFLVTEGAETTTDISHVFGIQLQILTAIAVSLENQDLSNKSGLLAYLHQQNQRNSFQLTGFQFPNGQTLLSDGKTTRNLLSATDVESAYEHSHFISAPRAGLAEEEQVIILGVPVLKNRKQLGIVFAVEPIKTYEEVLGDSSLGEKGLALVINKQGDVLIAYPRPIASNIFDIAESSLFDAGKSAGQIRHDMNENVSGVSGYTYNKIHRFSSYFPLGYNDWYVMSILPTESVVAKAEHLVKMSLFLCLSVIIALVILLLFILYLQHQSAKALFHTAFVDPLTGKDNLNAFQLKFLAAVQKFKQEQRACAMVLININSFKAVNNIYGFEQGDKVLQQVGKELQTGITENELFCRGGGDVFFFLMECPSREELGRRIDALTVRAGQLCHVGKEYLPLSFTCGIYVIDEDVPFYMMMDRANLAWASAKAQAGSKVYAFYDREYLRRIVTEKRIESSMEQALKDKEFKVYLQPKYDFKTGRLVSAEALVRWQHPEQGVIPPDWFIPVFEKNGFVLKLDMYILEEVAGLLQRRREANLPVVPIGVNFSRLHLDDPDFIDMLLQVMEKHNLPHNLVEVELTESMVMDDVMRMTRVLDELHIAGFSVAMDDFGAGYSSLNVLKYLDFDCVKLDKEFLAKGEGNPRMRQIISGLVKMIKEVGSHIVAEGVETKEQAEFLRSIGCDTAQGYLYSRPLPMDDFEQKLDEDARIAAEEEPPFTF